MALDSSETREGAQSAGRTEDPWLQARDEEDKGVVIGAYIHVIHIGRSIFAFLCSFSTLSATQRDAGAGITLRHRRNPYRRRRRCPNSLANRGWCRLTVIEGSLLSSPAAFNPRQSGNSPLVTSAAVDAVAHSHKVETSTSTRAAYQSVNTTWYPSSHPTTYLTLIHVRHHRWRVSIAASRSSRCNIPIPTTF